MSTMVPKIVIKIKSKPLYDEYILTNKHIICKFKFMIWCHNLNENTETQELICLSNQRLHELLTEQNLVLDSKNEHGHFSKILKCLKDWHPLISKVEMEKEKPYQISNIAPEQIDYQSCLRQCESLGLTLSPEQYEKIKNHSHCVCDIKVYFLLNKKIETVDEYHINFQYLHQLLSNALSEWNLERTINFDEMEISPQEAPLSQIPSDSEYYVYPYLGFVPLYAPLNEKESPKEE